MSLTTIEATNLLEFDKAITSSAFVRAAVHDASRPPTLVLKHRRSGEHVTITLATRTAYQGREAKGRPLDINFGKDRSPGWGGRMLQAIERELSWLKEDAL
jgi:hypothetical protein